jgi:hypothetical protein
MVPVTLQSSATTNATGTVVDVARYVTIGLDISITNTATVTFQARSSSGGTYTAIQCVNLETGVTVTTATASMQVQCNVAGLSQFKAPISGCSSCTVVVSGKLSTGYGRTIASTNVFYASAHGVACDGSTDDTAAIIALGLTAQTEAIASGGNTTVVFKHGTTCNVTNVTWPSRVSIDMNGASFAAVNGTDHTLPVLKIDGYSNSSRGLQYSNLAVTGLSSGTGAHLWNPTYAETSICIQFDGLYGAMVSFREVSGCFIDVQTLGDTTGYVGYNKFEGGFFHTTKVAFDVRTGEGGQWNNENSYTGLNIAPTSNMNNYGQLVGFRISSTDAGQHGQNNHRIHDVSFQIDDHTLDWSSGGTKTQYRRYANITGVNPKYWIFMSATGTGGSDQPPVTDTFTCVAGTDVCTFANYLPLEDTQFYATNSGGALPAGMSLGTWYWLVNVSGKDFSLSTTKGGGVLDITGAGTGTHSSEGQKGWQYVDNQTKTWQIEGVKARVPIYVEDTNFSQSKVTGSRWEGGFGPAVLYRMGARFASTNINQDNDFEFYGLPSTVGDGTSPTYPLGDLEPSTAITPTSYNLQSSIHGYGLQGSPPVESVLIDNISRRVVMSAQTGSSWAGTMTIAGMGFATRSAWATIQPYVTNAASGNSSILCKDSLAIQLTSNFWLPMVFVDAVNYKKFKIQPDLVSTQQWIYVKGFDSDFQPLSLDGQTHTVAGSQLLLQSSSGGFLNLSAANNVPIFAGVPNTTAGATTRYMMVALQSNVSTKIRGLTISTVPSYGFQNGSLRVVTPWGNASDPRRSSYGTPTGGWFMQTGEIITNLNTAGSQPLYWTVSTAGAMAPDYANATSIIAGELRSDGTNIKSATAACTTNGASMAADVGCTWTTQAPIAVLEPIAKVSKFTSINVTAGTLAQHDITGAQFVSLLSTNATPGNQTTRTATEMIADMGGGTGGSYALKITNSGAGTFTLVAGAGVTLTGTMTVATNTWREFVVTVNSATTLTIQSIGTGTI